MEHADNSCPHCGRPVAEDARFCPACGKSLAPSAAGAGSQTPAAASAPTKAGDDGLATLIPYRNMPALIGYYLSVFSLIPCLGLPLGIAAIVCGIVGLKKHRLEPTAKGTAHSWVAIVLGSMTTLAWGGGLVWILVVSR